MIDYFYVRVFGLLTELIERFSTECRKTKVITPTNHNTRKQRNEPIGIRSKYM